MVNMECEYYIGTGLKIQIYAEAQGFDQTRDNYIVEVSCGGHTETYQKSVLIGDGTGNYLLPLDTTPFPPGTLFVRVIADVPDTEFPPNNIRKEVSRQHKVGVLRK